jgi:hypothetical protein
MHPALKLCLNSFELRDHSLLRSDPPYGVGSALVALPTSGWLLAASFFPHLVPVHERLVHAGLFFA